MSHPTDAPGIKYYRPGLNDVGSYQISGIPYVTGAIDCRTNAKEINFPSVTSWIQVHSHGGAPLKIAFSEAAVESGGGGNNANNFFEIGPLSGSTGIMNLRVTQLWLKGSSNVQVVAGLTNILATDIDNNTVSPEGSNWSGSADAKVG